MSQAYRIVYVYIVKPALNCPDFPLDFPGNLDTALELGSNSVTTLTLDRCRPCLLTKSSCRDGSLPEGDQVLVSGKMIDKKLEFIHYVYWRILLSMYIEITR